MMKTKGNRVKIRLMLCLILGMLLSLAIGMSAFAEEEGYLDSDGIRHYNISVNGVEVTSQNKNDVLGDGKVSYDKHSLHLNNAVLTKCTDTAYGKAAIYTTEYINIYCEGENLIDLSAYGNVYGVLGVVSQGGVIFMPENTNETGRIDFRFSGTQKQMAVYADEIRWINYEANFYYEKGSKSYAMRATNSAGNDFIRQKNSTFHYYNLQYLPKFEQTDNPVTYYIKNGNDYIKTNESELVLPIEDGYSQHLFKDDDFYYYLTHEMNLDSNGDGRLSDKECEAVDELVFDGGGSELPFKDFDGLGNFPNLTVLKIWECGKVNYLDLSAVKQLKQLYIKKANLEGMDISRNETLQELTLEEDTVNDLKFGRYPELTYCYVVLLPSTYTTDFDFRASVKLGYILVEGAKGTIRIGDLSQLTNVTVKVREGDTGNVIIGNCPKLRLLTLDGLRDTSFDISGYPAMEKFWVSDNENLEKVIISGNQKLNRIDISDCPKIKSIDLSQAPNLTAVLIQDCNLEAIDVSMLNKLSYLAVNNNNLTELNIDNCPELNHLNCYQNRIKELNLSNNKRFSGGSAFAVGSQKDNEPIVIYVQDEQIESIREAMQYVGNSGKNKDVVVNVAPVEITKQPSESVVDEGAKATFSVTARGNGLSYQWQWRKNDSSVWADCGFTGAKTSAMTVDAIYARNGYQYRCRIKDSGGLVLYSEKASLLVTPSKLVIVKQPIDFLGLSGTKSIHVEANGKDLTYQWYWRKDSNSGWNISTDSGNKTDTLTVTVGAEKNGYQYRCEIKDTYGNKVISGVSIYDYTDSIHFRTLVVNCDVIANVGTTAIIRCDDAEGSGLTYQWYWRKNETAEWSPSTDTGCRTSILRIEAVAARNGYQYRCLVTNKYNYSQNSAIATLRVSVPADITQQPQNQSLNSGTAKFTVKAVGDGLTYQWQWRKNASSAWGAAGFTGCKTNTMSVEAISARNGYQYRCEVMDKYGNVVYSNPATLTVTVPATKLTITKQPVNQTAKSGNVKFSVAATGDGLTYQWQWRKNASSAWGAAGFTGAKTAEMTVEAISARNGFQYRCEIKDKYGNVIYSNPATLYVADKVKITKQPVDAAAGSGNVKFTVTAAGDGLSYQWQWRKNASAEWGAAGFTGAKTSSMTVEAISARNGFQYRCEVKDQYGNVVYSNPATLYVSATAKIIKQPANVTLKTGNAVFSVLAAGEGLTYQWQWRKNASSAWGAAGFTGAKTANMTVEVIAARNGFQYRCEVTDKYGNKVYSNPATLTYGSKATITKQPVSVKAAAGTTATFSLTATGDGLTYQWYWRKNASSDWGVCGFTGAKTASMQVEAIAARNGFQYQCVVKDKYGNAVSSQIVTLTVQ